MYIKSAKNDGSSLHVLYYCPAFARFTSKFTISEAQVEKTSADKVPSYIGVFDVTFR